MPDTTQNPFTRENLRELLASLLDGWARDRGAGRGFESKMHPAAVGTVYALAAHAHRLGCAVASLFDAELDVEAIPVIRAAYEATITASWIALIPDALPAYLNTNHQQQKTFRESVRKAGWSSGHDRAEVLEPHLVSGPSATGAAKIWVLCADFVKGDELYSLYRALCWMTHPTAMVTDLYLELKPGVEFPTLHTSAQVDDNEDFTAAWLFVLCSSLVWSARALNLIDHKRARSGDRTRLRQAAKRLNIDEYLEVKADAKFRGQKSEQRRTRLRSSTGELPDAVTIRPDRGVRR